MVILLAAWPARLPAGTVDQADTNSGKLYAVWPQRAQRVGLLLRLAGTRVNFSP